MDGWLSLLLLLRSRVGSREIVGSRVGIYYVCMYE